MNNLTLNCFEFIADTIGNRPKNNDGTTALYDEKSRNILLETIKQRKQEIVRFEDNAKEKYKPLLEIYDLMRMQLEEKKI